MMIYYDGPNRPQTRAGPAKLRSAHCATDNLPQPGSGQRHLEPPANPLVNFHLAIWLQLLLHITTWKSQTNEARQVSGNQKHTCPVEYSGIAGCLKRLFYSFDGSTIQVQVSAPLGYANHSRRRRMEMEMRTGMGWRSWLRNYSSNFLINCDSDVDSGHKSARQVNLHFLSAISSP